MPRFETHKRGVVRTWNPKLPLAVKAFKAYSLTKDYAENIILRNRGLRSAVLPKEFQG